MARWTAVVDHVVQALYAAARASYAERYTVLDQRVALIAQGGYGRAELNPCSDIDLLVLYPQRPDAFVETVTEKVLYALWDTGLTVGHALRNLRDCVKLGGKDLKVKTALLDTRFLAGDQALYAELRRDHGARAAQAQRGALLPRQGGGERGAAPQVRRLGLSGRAADQGRRGRPARHPHRDVARQGEVRRARSPAS